MKNTYMPVAKNALVIITLLVFASCRPNITEEKVRKAAIRSNEFNHTYLGNIEEKYTPMLEKRIANIEQDIKKLESVSHEGQQQAGTDINSSLDKLKAEKAELENRIKALHNKIALAGDKMEDQFNNYNRSLDSVLRDLNTFLVTYKIDAEAEKGK